MKILNRNEIEQALAAVAPEQIIAAIEQGFVQYSQGLANVPPVGELLMDKGEVHIKYGCIGGDDFYLVKVASGFYGNPELGLASSNGLMLLFSQQTGQPVCILLDEGYLTDVRTAIAGAVAAKYLAPKVVSAIGIVGTGTQARLQPRYLKSITDCRHIVVWGRNSKKLADYQQDMQRQGFTVTVTRELGELSQKANLIVTTTPSTTVLLKAAYIRPGTHITAVGSDTADKQELESDILAMADRVVADSMSQCQQRGEISQALKAKQISADKVLELGQVIASGQGRSCQQHITVADLTGVAVQDIKIAQMVYLYHQNQA
ncbi:MAG: ornithine cyclodeaminase [Phenylobacterium sp.]|jgi:ornithine cyclodeaminase